LVFNVFPGRACNSVFLTLNFNHVALYAPSDYSNDRGFMQANGKMIGNDVQDTDATQGFELT
jgi:hypothetical protein